MPYGDTYNSLNDQLDYFGGATPVQPMQVPPRPGQRARLPQQAQPFLEQPPAPPGGGNVATFLGAPEPPPQANVGAFLGAQPPAPAQPQQHRMTIQNGANVGVFDYSRPNQGSPWAGTQVTNKADPEVSQWLNAGFPVEGANAPAHGFGPLSDQQRNTAIQRVSMGLPFGTQDFGTDPNGQPLQGVPAMQEFLTGAQLGGVGANAAGQMFSDQQRSSLLERQMDEAEKVQYRQVYAEAMKRLQSQPIPHGGRAMTQQEMMAAAQKEADDFLSAFRTASTASLPTKPGTPSQPAAPVSPERQKLNDLGPIPGWLQNPGIDAAAFWRSVLAHDKQNQGFMATHGPAVIDEFKRQRGADALSNFMNPGMIESASSGLGNLFRSDYSDTEQARAALRHFMGVGKPMGLWGRAASRAVGAGDIEFPHRGLPPIPGSPGAR